MGFRKFLSDNFQGSLLKCFVQLDLQIATVYCLAGSIHETHLNADCYALLVRKVGPFFISHDSASMALDRVNSRLGALVTAIDSKNRVDGLTVHTQGITRVAGEAAIIFRR